MRHTSGLLVVCMLIAAAVCVQAQENDPLAQAATQIVEKLVLAATPKSGPVAAVDNGTVPATLYVALGTRDGIMEGALLTIVAKGEAIKIGDEVVGYRESPVGTAEVLRVQSEKLSIAQVKSQVAGQKPIEGNMAYIKTLPSTLAVTAFLRADGVGCQMGVDLADKLTGALQGSGRFQMVERKRLETALGELKLSLNDLFNSEKAAQLGKQVTAKGVVLGGITQKNDGYTISARVVDIETGVQVATATATCPKTAELDAKYGQAVAQGGGPDTGTGGGGGGVRVLYVGSDKDMVHNEGVKNLLSEAGFDVDARPTLPDSLAQYKVVIYDKTEAPEDARQQKGVAKSLYAVAGGGRGVVLGGLACFSFGMPYSGVTQDASSWVGCGEFDASTLSGGTLQLARSRPFGLEGIVGTTVHQFSGGIQCFAATPERLEPSAQPVAQLVSGRRNSVGAYANSFGKGRVYFQYLTYHPNSPQLNSLFIGGVRWAAGLVDLEGKNGFQ